MRNPGGSASTHRYRCVGCSRFGVGTNTLLPAESGRSIVGTRSWTTSPDASGTTVFFSLLFSLGIAALTRDVTSAKNRFGPGCALMDEGDLRMRCGGGSTLLALRGPVRSTLVARPAKSSGVRSGRSVGGRLTQQDTGGSNHCAQLVNRAHGYLVGERIRSHDTTKPVVVSPRPDDHDDRLVHRPHAWKGGPTTVRLASRGRAHPHPAATPTRRDRDGRVEMMHASGRAQGGFGGCHGRSCSLVPRRVERRRT